MTATQMLTETQMPKTADASLARLLDALELNTELSELSNQLFELLPLLVEEFSAEERENGLHGEIRRLNPTGSRVALLDQQHVDVLKSAAAILARCDQCLEDLARVNKLRGALAWMIRDHLRLENQLLLDAYFRDVGGH